MPGQDRPDVGLQTPLRRSPPHAGRGGHQVASRSSPRTDSNSVQQRPELGTVPGARPRRVERGAAGCRQGQAEPRQDRRDPFRPALEELGPRHRLDPCVDQERLRRQRLGSV